MPHSDVFQFYSVHQVMQGHVGITATQARKQWSHEAGKGHERIAAKCAEQQIEPNHVGLKPVESLQKTECAAGIIERPATLDAESGRLDMIW
jgi:hypothetical protein